MVADQSPLPEKQQSKLVNRREELGQLLDLVSGRSRHPSFIILKSPPGHGKTKLTDKLIDVLRSGGEVAVVLEPEIRDKNLASCIYQGYFIQRCAMAFDEYVRTHGKALSMPTFEGFLKTSRIRRVKSTNWLGTLRKLPGLKSAYELGVELYDRYFNTGEHSPKKLLESDSREAVASCSDYIRLVTENVRIIIVVREAQHIDRLSLQLLSEIVGVQSPHSIILEYTLDATGDLNPLYADFLESAPLHDNEWLCILELFRLTKPHLEELLHQTIPGAEDISGEYYLHWDGNVRAIRQLRFSLLFEHQNGIPQLSNLKQGVIQEYQSQIPKLSSTDRMCLCLLYSHSEAMPRLLLRQLLNRLNALATQSIVDQGLEAMIDIELIALHPGDSLGLENEDIAEAIRTLPALAGNLLLAKGALRDYYRLIISDSIDGSSDVSLAVRQALRLSVELGDATTIEEVVDQLSSGVITTIDQSWYVSQIVMAVGGKTQLFADQQDRLLLWAAELAYEISDFHKARDLLQKLSLTSTFSDALLCACLSETGNHGEAAQKAELLKISDNPEERMVGQLVELILLRCTGRVDEARNLWHQLVTVANISELNLYGYLLRFKELIADFPDCVDALRSSIEWFLARGLESSAAYSGLTLASHLARMGDIVGAVTAIEQAKELLTSTARDQHILLNNEVAVNLLSQKPEAAWCCERLIRAIPCSGDDYSDLVLYTNLAVSAALAQRVGLATEAIERALRIVNTHKFADKDVFWGTSFNLEYVNKLLGLGWQAELSKMVDSLKPHSLQNEYWQYRRGLTSSVPERFQYMLGKQYHPMFLSHWTIDVDGLRVLKQVPSQSPLGTTNLSS